MRSIQLTRIYAIASQIEAEAMRKYNETGKSPWRAKLRRSVLVCLDEGSIFHINNCFVESYENEDGMWYILFAEHHDTMIYHADDVDYIKQFKPGQIEIAKTKWKPTLKVIKP
jgi:hypothetical protein